MTTKEPSKREGSFLLAVKGIFLLQYDEQKARDIFPRAFWDLQDPILVFFKAEQQVFPGVAIGGQDSLSPPPAQLLHDPARRIRLCTVSPGDGPGVDLENYRCQ